MKQIKLTVEEMREWRGAGEETRGIIKNRLLERNGGVTFKLLSNTGRMLGTVQGQNNIARDPSNRGPSTAPPPESCHCKEYAGTPPDNHHAVCVHFDAWNRGQGVKVNVVESQYNRVTHQPASIPTSDNGVRRFALPTLQQSVSVATGLVNPEHCTCKSYTKPAGEPADQHHSICPNYQKWKDAHPSGPTPLPSTLDLQQKRSDSSGRVVVPNVVDNNETTTDVVRNTSRAERNPAVPKNPNTQMASVDHTVRGDVAALADTLPHVNENDPAVINDTEPPPPVKHYGIYDLETRVFMREADEEEITEGLRAEQATGASIVTIDRVQYALLEITPKEVTPGE